MSKHKRTLHRNKRYQFEIQSFVRNPRSTGGDSTDEFYNDGETTSMTIIPGDKRKLRRIKNRIRKQGDILHSVERQYWPGFDSKKRR